MQANRKDRELLSRFEPLALRSRFHRNEGFHYNHSTLQLNLIPQDHSVSQHLQTFFLIHASI